jgi:N-terminal domain of anti-restriction factor ArdC
MAKSSRHLSEHDRAERRRRDREHLQRAAKELLSSDGWARWVRVRAMFHSYSAHNCMLLATQCHERGIVPTRIAGFRTWLKLGRCVRKGEVALRILAPVSLKERDRLTGEETDERRVFFKTAFVFDVSQTEIRDGAEPAELEPPHQPLTGDSHAHLLAPLQTFAESLGYSVSFETIDGSAGGWCDPQLKRIVVDANVPANAQLRTLIHETAHALGVDYVRYPRAQAEVIVDTVVFCPLSAEARVGVWAERA